MEEAQAVPLLVALAPFALSPKKEDTIDHNFHVYISIYISESLVHALMHSCTLSASTPYKALIY